jgi:xylan 1,4-beta-xylosidase
MSKNLQLTVSAVAAGTALPHFWSTCVGAGRANEGLRANWLEHLLLAREQCGFRYVRFHGLFHDDMFVCREEAGRLIYNFQYTDELFDRMLDLGVRPFVELGFSPACLATAHGTTMWWKGHGAPPKDYAMWAELVDRFVRHCVARYGLDEVCRWYFEVWNEPNLDGFFRGTRSQYFELYRTSAKAIKAIDARLRVGGPATSNFVPDGRFDGEKECVSKQVLHSVADINTLEWKPVWVEAFLAFCARERLPVDFLSTHPYPTDFALDGHGECKGRSRSVNSTRDDLRWLRRAIDGSAFPQAEIHLTEWSSSPSSRDHSHDHLPAAAFILKANLDSRRLVNSLSYWVFTDVFEEAGAGDTVFHGGFGLINFQGIVKPAFHAYRFLAALGDQELAATDGLFVSRHGPAGAVTALAYNYPDEYPEAVAMVRTPEEAEAVAAQGSAKALSLRIADLKPGATFQLETLERNHGCALDAWKALGAPEPPTRRQLQSLRESALALRREFVTVGADGILSLERTLAPWSIACLTDLSTWQRGARPSPART